MKKICNSILAFILVFCMILTLPGDVWAAGNQQNAMEEIGEELEVTEETAEKLVTDMFGEPLEEGTETGEGYQYKVSNDAFSGIIDGIEDMHANETGEQEDNTLDEEGASSVNNEEESQDENNGEETTEEPSQPEEESANNLPEDYVDNSNEQLYKLLEEAQNADAAMARSGGSDTKVEVVFVIDSTGSMGGEITAVKNNVAEFAQYLSERNLSLRLGLIDYRDITVDGADSTVIHSAEHSNWMNVTQFITALTEVSANGGGDADETPIDALAHLTEGSISWSSDAYKFAVLITDAGYKNDNNHGISGMDDMIQRLSNADIQVSTITTSGYFDEYGSLAGMTGGIQGDLNGDFSEILRDYAEAVVGGAQPTQDYTVRISEETTGLPIQGANISWNGGSASTTDENGMTIITTRNNPIRSVYISCLGYNPVELDELELFSQGCINLTMTVNESEAAEAGDGVPVLTASMFQNPKDGSDSAEGPYIEILGKRFNLFNELSLPVDFNPFGEKLNIVHNKEEKKYEVIIGQDFQGYSEDNRGYWEESYDQFKALAQKFTDKSAKEIYNDFRSLRKITKSKEDLLLPLDVYVGGYAEGSYASGTLNLVEGSVIVGASLSDDVKLFEYRIPPAPYIFFKLSFNYDVKAGFTIVTVEDTGKQWGLSEALIELKPALKGTLNAGVDKLAYVGGGLEGELQTQLEIPFERFSEAVDVKLNGSFIISLKLLGFEFSDDFPFGSMQIYPAERSRQAALVQGDMEDFVLISRPESVQKSRNMKDSGFIYQRENTYSDNAPQIVQLADGSWLTVWVDAVPEREDNDMTALYYTLSSDGRNWTEPALVYDDGTGDFMPSLTLAGDGTPVLVWQNSSQTYGDRNLDLETRAKDIEISATIFDIAAGTFEEPVTVTSDENQICEMAVQIVPQAEGAAVYWLENSENSLLLASGTNKIRTSSWNKEENTWSEPQTLLDGLGNLTNFSAGEISGQPYVAYSVENENTVHYYNQSNGSQGRMSAEGALSGARIDSGRLYWSDQSALYSWDGSGITEESSSLAAADFDIVQNGDTRVAILSYSEGITNELWVSMCNGTEWSEPVALTDYGMTLGTASAVLKDNELYWAVGRTEADDENNTFGATDLILDSTAFEADIVVNETANVSELEDTSDGTIDVFVDISNQGLADGEAMKAVFYRNGEAAGESALYIVDEENPGETSGEMSGIKRGEKIFVAAQYQLPEENREHELEVRITSQDGSATYGSAYVTIPAAAADLTVNDITVARGDSGAVVTAVIRNEGQSSADGITAVLSQEDMNGNETKELGSLEPGEETSVEFNVGSDRLSAESPYDNKRFIVTVQTESYEPMTGNNSGDVLLAPVAVESLKLSGEEEITLGVGETYNLDYEIFPAEAPSGTVSWMSDNTSIATVEEGEILALQPGTAIITALITNAAGEQLTDSVTVTVSGESHVGVSGISIEPDRLEVSVGRTVELAAQILPENATNRNIIWTTDREDIIQLSPVGTGGSVNILGLATGTATLVGETEDGGYTDSVEIEVTEAVMPETYAVTVEACEYGTIISEPAEAREGETITLTVTPEAGYILNSVAVSDEEGNLLELAKTESGYTFVMPASNVTVAAVFESIEHIHTEVIDPEVPATCTADGMTQGSHCSVCGEVIVPQEVIPALGHDYVYKDNTDGTHSVTCTRCDYNQIEKHTYENNVCKFCNSKMPEAVCVGRAEVEISEDTLELSLGGSEVGTFSFCQKNNGWTIQDENGMYIAVTNGKIEKTKEEFIWTYSNDRFSTKVVSRGWLWFKWTTTYYLVCSNKEIGISRSSKEATAKFYTSVNNTEHTYGEWIGENGKHTHTCIYCGYSETKDCKYDSSTHKCVVCGSYDPAIAYIEVSVESTKHNRGFWFWRTSYYTINISTKSYGTEIAKIEYSLDNESWKNGDSFISKTEVDRFYIRVTDAEGTVYNWLYSDGDVTEIK